MNEWTNGCLKWLPGVSVGMYVVSCGNKCTVFMMPPVKGGGDGDSRYLLPSCGWEGVKPTQSSPSSSVCMQVPHGDRGTGGRQEQAKVPQSHDKEEVPARRPWVASHLAYPTSPTWGWRRRMLVATS